MSFSGSIGDTSANTLPTGDNPRSGPGLLLTKNGAGLLILLGANTYSGGTNVTAGVLQGNTMSLQGNIANASTVIFDQPGTGTYAGVISGMGAVIKQNAGKVTLAGINTYSGGTTINEGTLALSGAGTLNSMGNVVINAGTFDISGITASSQTIGNLSGAGFINLGAKQLIAGASNSTTYAGVIQGTGGVTKQGSGIFTLTGANTYSGGTTINAGTLALSGAGALNSTGDVIINAGTFDISGITAPSQTIGDLSGAGMINLGAKELIEGSDNNTSYSGIIQGTNGSFTKQGGGMLMFTGMNTCTGNTNVNDGMFLVNGMIEGSVNVAANATLGGIGAVGNLVNAGFVSPGQSIETLTVNGNYTQLPNGQLVIEIAPNGATDLLDVTGAATLDGSLHIIPEVGVYPENTIYTFLTAASVTGVFSSNFSDIPIPYSVNYSPTSAFLIVSPFIITPVPNSDLSGNARTVADYLFCTSFDFNNQDLVNLAEALTALSPTAYPEALNTLTPVPFAAFALEELENNYNVASTFFGPQVGQNPPCCEGIEATTNIWLSPIGFIYTQDNQHETPGFNDHTYGFSAGIDGLVVDDLSIGVGIGYTHTHLSWNWGRGRANANSAYLGPYLKYNYKDFYLDFLVLGVGNFYDVSRKIQFPGYSRKADSHPTTWIFQRCSLWV
ncbi:autotransporter outer membrane beta-barrel domain-containing protein [Candidatus Rhabdochlamydia porcellionis]|nr:autotransporter outer membrane beta-barrel domain-containing protein [Candidatus Rhabdochlamydia porcellionis]